MRTHAEHLIVGAGAAGCTLAWLLRQAGRDVLVLELQDAQTKDKLCGGALCGEAVRAIGSVFGEDAVAQLAPFSPPHMRSRCLDREIVGGTTIATLPRKRLDDWLLARCVEAGAEVRGRVRLTSIDKASHTVTCEDARTGETLRLGYDVLIGADGAASATRRLLTGRQQRLATAIEGPVPLLGEDILLAYHPGQAGYCWYIPTGEAANVGCLLHAGSAADCRAWLVTFCADLGVALPALRGAPVPSGDDVLLHAGENAWLVGDAAGLVRPFDGGGIHHAFASARALASALLGGEAYEAAMQPTIEGIAQAAATCGQAYFLTSLGIARTGQSLPKPR